MRFRLRASGYALITTLIMLMLLFMMVLTLILSTRHSSFLTRGYHDRTAALYIAESGLARALEMLAEDPEWAPQDFTESMPSGHGYYTISFQTAGGAVQKHQSVNNFEGSEAVAGARGPMTVPAASTSVVVVGRSGTSQRTIEAIVSLGGGLSIEYPMINSGRLVMVGNVRINGLESLDSEERVPAGIHSNSPGRGGLPTIFWEPQRAIDRAEIAGRVSTVDSSGGAIEFDSSTDLSPVGLRYSVGEMESGASPQGFPPIPDIAQTIHSKRNSPSPSFTTGVNTLAEGEYYAAGDVEIHGDLHLNGGDLYVEKSLTVHGAITGKGSVFVGEETAFYGDAHIEGNNRTAIFSKGNVTLSGYSGTQYLEDIASADPVFAAMLNDTNTIMDWMQGRVQQAAAAGNLGTVLYAGSQFDDYRRALGQEDGPVPTGLQNDTVGSMIAVLASQEESMTRDFVVNKLRSLKDFAAGKSSDDIGDFAENPRFMVETLDIINDNAHYHHLIFPAMNLLETVSLDQIGASYFQGVVYTNGHLYAENDVTVLGAVVARDDGSQEKLGDRHPGDIYLMNNTHITYIKDFFEEDEEGSQWSVGGSFRISSWIGE